MENVYEHTFDTIVNFRVVIDWILSFIIIIFFLLFILLLNRNKYHCTVVAR